MAAAKNTNSKLNIWLIITVLVVVIVFVGGYVVVSTVLPKLIANIVTSTVNNSVNDIDFTNAQLVTIDQDLSQNQGMILQVGVNKGKVSIDANDNGDKILGTVAYLGGEPLIDYQTDKDKHALFTIKSAGQDGEEVKLHLSQLTNARIDIGIAAGQIDVDLTKLDIPYLNIGAAAGNVNVIFSGTKPTEANISASVGKVNISVPRNLEFRVEFAQALPGSNTIREDLISVDNGYQTKGFENAEKNTVIRVGQSVGGFSLQTIE